MGTDADGRIVTTGSVSHGRERGAYKPATFGQTTATGKEAN